MRGEVGRSRGPGARRPALRSGTAGAAPTRRRSSLQDTFAFKLIALTVLTVVALLLWQLAVPRVVAQVRDAGASTVAATVTQCPQERGLTRTCVVRWTDAAGVRTEALTDPGLFAPTPGETLPVLLRPGGVVAVAGWRALLDAALLLTLAIALTGFAIGWWRRVLEHGPLAADDLDEDDVGDNDLGGPPPPHA